MELNLPQYDHQLRQQDGKNYIYDDLRRRYVRLTPEEWVRQHFVHYLLDHLGYPAPLMMNEVGLELGQTKKRCDTLLYDKQLQPLMILEYKAPQVPITDAVLQQIIRYNYTLRVPYLVLSNGRQHYAWRVDYEAQSYTPLPQLPSYDQLLKPER